MYDKKMDLAGPGIGSYDEIERVLPQDYSSLLDVKDTQKAIYAIKNYVEENLNKELNTTFVFATHDDKVITYLRRIIHLEDGKVVSDENVKKQ